MNVAHQMPRLMPTAGFRLPTAGFLKVTGRTA